MTKEFIWNLLGSTMNAGLSVVLSLVITRTQGINGAGIFSWAWAMTNLLSTFALFGTRKFQSTDVENKYSFKDYFFHRIITSCFMIIIIFVVVIKNNYSLETRNILICLCIYKIIDIFSDVFQGELQLQRKLNIAGKSLVLRSSSSILVFTLVSYTTQNALLPYITIVVTNLLGVVLYDFPQIKLLNLKSEKLSVSHILCLFKATFPLFLVDFLSMYILNISKYTMENIISYELQGIFNIIFLPVFTLNLIVGFVIHPYIVPLANQFQLNDKHKFIGSIKNLIIFTFLTGLIILIIGYLIGLPILSVLYKTNVTSYKLEFLFLLIGGVINGLVNILYSALTVMRKQGKILISYLITSSLAWLISIYLIKKYGLLGASLSGTIVLFILQLCMAIQLIFELKKLNNKTYISSSILY